MQRHSQLPVVNVIYNPDETKEAIKVKSAVKKLVQQGYEVLERGSGKITFTVSPRIDKEGMLREIKKLRVVNEKSLL